MCFPMPITVTACGAPQSAPGENEWKNMTRIKELKS